MSTVLTKRNKRRKNKRQGNTGKGSPSQVNKTTNGNSNNTTTDKNPQLVSNGELELQSSPELDVESEKCFICQKCYTETNSQYTIKKINCLKNQSEETPLYICSFCKEKQNDVEWMKKALMENGKYHNSTKTYDHSDLNGSLSDAIPHLWLYLHTVMQDICSSVSIQHVNQDEFEAALHRLFDYDPHLLYQKLENEVLIHLTSSKRELVKQLTKGYKTPELAHAFVDKLLHAFKEVMEISLILHQFVQRLNEEHLARFDITFQDSLKASFQQLIYSEKIIHRALPEITEQLRAGHRKLEESLDPKCDVLNKSILDFLIFESQMIEIQGKWRDAQQLIDDYTDEEVDRKHAEFVAKGFARDMLPEEHYGNFVNTPTNQSCQTSTTSVVTMTIPTFSNPVKSFFSNDYFSDIHPPSVSSNDSGDSSDNGSSSPIIVTHPGLILPRELENSYHLNDVGEWSSDYNYEPAIEGTLNERAFNPPNQFSFKVSHPTATPTYTSVTSTSHSQQIVTTSTVFSSNLTSCLTISTASLEAEVPGDGTEAPVCTPHDTSDDISSGSDISAPEDFPCPNGDNQYKYNEDCMDDSDEEYEEEAGNVCRCPQCLQRKSDIDASSTTNPVVQGETGTSSEIDYRPQNTVGSCKCASCQQTNNTNTANKPDSNSIAPTYLPTLPPTQFQASSNSSPTMLHSLPYSLQKLGISPNINQVYQAPMINGVPMLSGFNKNHQLPTLQSPLFAVNKTSESPLSPPLYSQMDSTSWHQNNLPSWMPYQMPSWPLQKDLSGHQTHTTTTTTNCDTSQGTSGSDTNVQTFSSGTNFSVMRNHHQIGTMSYSTTSYLNSTINNPPSNSSLPFTQTSPVCLTSASAQPPASKMQCYFQHGVVHHSPKDGGQYMSDITVQTHTEYCSTASSTFSPNPNHDKDSNKLSPTNLQVQQQIQRRKKLVPKLRQQIKKSSNGTQTSPAAGQVTIVTNKDNTAAGDSNKNEHAISKNVNLKFLSNHEAVLTASHANNTQRRSETDPESGPITGTFGNVDYVRKDKRMHQEERKEHREHIHSHGHDEGSCHSAAHGNSCTSNSCQSQADASNAAGGNSSSSTNSSSSGNSKYCDCCYCEFFGNGGPPTTPTSKNYSEMRDRLRIKLTQNKLKQNGHGQEVICENKNFPPPSEKPADKQDNENKSIDEILSFIEGNTSSDAKSKKAAKRAKQKQRREAELARKQQEELEKQKREAAKTDSKKNKRKKKQKAAEETANVSSQKKPNINPTTTVPQIVPKVTASGAKTALVKEAKNPSKNNDNNADKIKQNKEAKKITQETLKAKPEAQSPKQSPSANEQQNGHNETGQKQSPSKNSRKAKKGKAQLSESHSNTVDHVFLPRPEVDLETGDLDDIEKDVEHFKRFCLNSSTINQEKKKININWNSISFKKNNIAS